MIYADNAATTKLDEGALKKMLQCLEMEYGNASQPYAFARTSKKILNEARTQIAECINAKDNEIFFTSGGTESNNWVIKGFASLHNYDCHIVTSQIEHHSVLNAVKSVEALGIAASYIEVNAGALLDKEIFFNSLNRKTGLASIMFANNEVGTIQNVEELCNYAHQKKYLFHTDAVQAIGHIKIDVKELGVDFLSASAHKFNGPKGIGFLYIREGIRLPALLDGGNQEYGLRAGTENTAAIIAMATALENNCNNIDKNKRSVLECEDAFVKELEKLNILFVRNGSVHHLPGNISVSFPETEGEILLHRLDLKGIYVSTGSACDSMRTQISHVLRAMNLDAQIAEGTIRISFGKDNTKDEAIAIAHEIKNIIEQIRYMS